VHTSSVSPITTLPLTPVQPHNWLKGELTAHEDMWTELCIPLARRPGNEPTARGALRALYNRCEALRTRVIVDGTTVQQAINPRVQSDSELQFVELDVPSLENDPVSRARRRAAVVGSRPLDIRRSGAPFAIANDGVGNRALVIMIHHMFIDGFAIRVLREMASYRLGSLANGVTEDHTADSLGLDYYAGVERQAHARANAGHLVALLQRPPEGSPFADLPRANDELWDRVDATLSQSLTTSVQALARRLRTTVGAVLNIALALLLNAYSPGQSPILQTVSLNRDSTLDMQAIACLSNDSPVIVDPGCARVSALVQAGVRAHAGALRRGWHDQMELVTALGGSSNRYMMDMSAISNINIVPDSYLTGGAKDPIEGAVIGKAARLNPCSSGVNPTRRPWEPPNQHLYLTALIGSTTLRLQFSATAALGARRAPENIARDFLRCLEVLEKEQDYAVTSLPVDVL